MLKKTIALSMFLLFFQQNLLSITVDTHQPTIFGYTRPQNTSIMLSVVSFFCGTLSAAWSWDIIQKNPRHRYLATSLAALGSAGMLYGCKEGYRVFSTAPLNPVIELRSSGCILYTTQEPITLSWDEIETFDITGNTFIFLLKSGAVYTLDASELDIPLQQLYIAIQQYYRAAHNSLPY